MRLEIGEVTAKTIVKLAESCKTETIPEWEREPPSPSPPRSRLLTATSEEAVQFSAVGLGERG